MHAGERLKSGLKRAVRAAMTGPPRSREGCCVILTYHSVGTRDHEMNVTPAAFREQMAWLRDHMPVLPLRDAVARSEGVALTFDDGYRDNLTEAAPILAEFGMPATVFAVAGRMGGWLDHDKRTDDARLMTWDELSALAQMGWEVGGHTMTHPHLARLSEADQRREIGDGKWVIEGQLQTKIESFAYPYGSALDFNDASKTIVRQAGYRIALSNQYGVNQAGADTFALRRIWIDRGDTIQSFQAKVDGRLDRMSWMDSELGIRARRLGNTVFQTR